MNSNFYVQRKTSGYTSSYHCASLSATYPHPTSCN